MLSLYRRHKKTCPGRRHGAKHTRCDCPIYCDGMVGPQRIRQSMETANWERARQRAAKIEDEILSPKIKKPVADAARAFLGSREVESSTGRKYKRIMARLTEFAEANRIPNVEDFTLEHLDKYRETRPLRALSWQKELQLLRTFFGYALKRKWCDENPASDMDMPPDPKPRPREPYTSDEVIAILKACDTFGRTPYERLRAKAMIQLMRRYGLRLSDVATLERERIQDNRIFLHAMKNGAALWLPLLPDVKAALEMVPPVHGTEGEGKYFFCQRKGRAKATSKPSAPPCKQSSAGAASRRRPRIASATLLPPKS